MLDFVIEDAHEERCFEHVLGRRHWLFGGLRLPEDLWYVFPARRESLDRNRCVYGRIEALYARTIPGSVEADEASRDCVESEDGAGMGEQGGWAAAGRGGCGQERQEGSEKPGADSRGESAEELWAFAAEDSAAVAGGV